MAITQISQIKHRRGVETDLPQLASAELGWSVDTQNLYIGNGTIEEGAPEIGNTRILTENDLDSIIPVTAQTLIDNTTSNIDLPNSIQIDSTRPGTTLNYVITRGASVRVGALNIAQLGANLSYNEDYTETGNVGVTFSVTQISNTYSQISYTTTSTGTNANLKFSLSTITF